MAVHTSISVGDGYVHLHDAEHSVRGIVATVGVGTSGPVHASMLARLTREQLEQLRDGCNALLVQLPEHGEVAERYPTYPTDHGVAITTHGQRGGKVAGHVEVK